jgi:hypothetical protein
MAMSPRLLRPRASAGYGLDARDWQSRVVANGGSVSASTMKAVDTFCKSIVTAGIRDRFFRMNLFAGTGLSAALVPLFRGQSLGGTQYGNTTDTNFNFVSGDYSETSTGLTGDGSSKHLRTGLSPDNIGLTECHIGIYTSRNTFPAAQQNAVGTLHQSTRRHQLVYTATAISGQLGLNQNAPSSGTIAAGSVVVQRIAGTANTDRYFSNGQQIGATSVSTISPSANPRDFYVFANNNDNGGAGTFFSADLRSYSIGLTFTVAQALAYHNALQAFQTALGRNL